MQIETEKVWTPTHEQLIAMGFEWHLLSESYWRYEYWNEHSRIFMRFYLKDSSWEIGSTKFYPRSEEAMIEIIRSFTPPNINISK